MLPVAAADDDRAIPEQDTSNSTMHPPADARKTACHTGEATQRKKCKQQNCLAGIANLYKKPYQSRTSIINTPPTPTPPCVAQLPHTCSSTPHLPPTPD
jgi:hypothetical protein